MANKYTISKGSAPVEKNIISLSYKGLIDACQFDEDTFIEWLDENYYDDVSSGEEYENELITKEIISPDGTKKEIEIPVKPYYNSFEDEINKAVTDLKDFDRDDKLVIAYWKTYSDGSCASHTFELNEREQFDPNKIKATGEYDLVTGYQYGDQEFYNDGDDEGWYGSIEFEIYLKIDNSLYHLYDFQMSEIRNTLLDEDLEICSSNSEKIFSFLKNNFFDKEFKFPEPKSPLDKDKKMSEKLNTQVKNFNSENKRWIEDTLVKYKPDSFNEVAQGKTSAYIFREELYDNKKMILLNISKKDLLNKNGKNLEQIGDTVPIQDIKKIEKLIYFYFEKCIEWCENGDVSIIENYSGDPLLSNNIKDLAKKEANSVFEDNELMEHNNYSILLYCQGVFVSSIGD